jgi:hypothetical protein
LYFKKDTMLCKTGCPTVCVSRWWARRDSLREQEKARSQKNIRKSGRIPPVGCTLCWHAFDLQDSLPEKKYCRRIVEIIARTFDFGNNQKTDLQMFRQGLDKLDHLLNNQRWLFKELLQSKTYDQKTRWL